MPGKNGIPNRGNKTWEFAPLKNIMRRVNMQRIQLTYEQIDNTIQVIIDMFMYRLKQKGYGTFTSRHEILGVITEEYKEFKDAVHSKDYKQMENELIDIAVGAIFGVVCFREKTIDW